jgi:hypothetical protein
MMEASVSFNAKAVKVKGTDGGRVTWGAEKEGSSSIITRVTGPTIGDLNDVIDSGDSKAFYKAFFKGWLDDDASRSFRVYKDEDGVKRDSSVDLKDHKGRQKKMDISFLRGFDPNTASRSELKRMWEKWCEKTNDNPFSYIAPKTRRKIFRGEFPGMGGEFDWEEFVPLIGKAQKFIEEVEDTSVGWEILFKPQDSYGEFQEMILWFRKVMNKNGELFQAPGHQRMVFPIPDDFKWKKAAELTKVAQALIVLEGVSGGVGIEKSSYKDVLSDREILDSFEYDDETGRGPLRVDEWDRFLENSRSIEFRAGTKDARVARFIQAAMAARMAKGDFRGVKDGDDWDLFKLRSDIRHLKKFGVNTDTADKAKRVLNRVGLDRYNVVFWNWYKESNPMVSESKRLFLKNLTKTYLESLAKLDVNDPDVDKAVISLQRDWVKSSNLIEDVRNYMRPNRKLGNNSNRFHHFKLPAGFDGVDVNKVDLGIEYSARFPLKLEADYAMETTRDGGELRKRLDDGRMSWIQTRVDMGPKEKEAFLYKIADDLRKNLGGVGSPEKLNADGGHGHDLGVAFEIIDSKERKWRVEWDGIGRSYTEEGELVEDSVRGGSIEVVTPKFRPEMREVRAIYKSFYDNNALPYIKAGGGHVNIDLSVFDGKPRQMARFLATFHEHRSIIAFMFQDLNRNKSAEPVRISDDFARELADWTESEKKLKKALYNNGYFNQRVGRKTRYTHIDMSAYFQDVIPKEFISKDFDISNPDELWRPAFRVDPKVRKGEFRLFNAPRDAYESALQMKLVRALLNKALNDEGEISGAMQNVSHEDYTKKPSLVFEHLKEMCRELGLDADEFRPIAGEALSNTDLYMKSRFYKSLDEKLSYHPRFTGWGSASTHRSGREALSSGDRTWSGGELPEALHFQEKRIEAAKQNAIDRSDPSEQNRPRLHHNSDSCRGIIQRLM